MAVPKKRKRYNWVKLKAEYQTTDISLRDLAKKHNIPWGTVNSRSNTDKWAKDKPEIRSKIEAASIQKTAEKIIEKNVDYNVRHLEVFEGQRQLIDRLQKLFLDSKARKSDCIYLEKLSKASLDLQKAERMALNMDTKNPDAEETEPEILTIEGLDISKI